MREGAWKILSWVHLTTAMIGDVGPVDQSLGQPLVDQSPNMTECHWKVEHFAGASAVEVSKALAGAQVCLLTFLVG